METDLTTKLIEQLHAADDQFVLAVTGGGSAAISRLLAVPGASRTLLSASVPYSVEALQDYLRDWDEPAACTEQTARRMAVEAFDLASGLVDPDQRVHGVGCTASLASDRAKRGPHRVHVAVQAADRTACYSLQLDKGARSRPDEELVAAALVLDAMAEAAGIPHALTTPLLRPGEEVCRVVQQAPPEWPRLGTDVAWRHGMGRDGEAATPAPPIVFPGAFNPLHDGHLAMAAAAEELLGQPVVFELSMENVDKPPLDFVEVARRVERFGERPYLITLAPTFVEKATLLPGCTFVVGIDTLIRIADEDYYDESEALRDEAIDHIADAGCRFLVFGRAFDGEFIALDDLGLPQALTDLCTGVPENKFRVDLSSTELREAEADE
ncbi:Cytidylyltransferase [Posidoniimonas polymericola]|uniref:Cytidylyltransferase n=1 Tax=Posidoniimonas polymericola TaxID=2528002 RepID=A0A5C5YU14_9BACT|nr:hypothetical protein [Posidoniimonas polymericola]TWT78475.1 Cytidylyltransferase [Posidoniimonas polymericola]